MKTYVPDRHIPDLPMFDRRLRELFPSYDGSNFNGTLVMLEFLADITPEMIDQIETLDIPQESPELIRQKKFREFGQTVAIQLIDQVGERNMILTRDEVIFDPPVISGVKVRLEMGELTNASEMIYPYLWPHHIDILYSIKDQLLTFVESQS